VHTVIRDFLQIKTVKHIRDPSFRSNAYLISLTCEIVPSNIHLDFILNLMRAKIKRALLYLGLKAGDKPNYVYSREMKVNKYIKFGPGK
jgi:hypothetical protein